MAKSAAKFAKGAGGAGAAAAAAAASAAKAAKGAAGAAAAAAAKAAKAAGKSAGEAAAAAAKSAKKAAGSAGDLGKAGKKVGKNADSVSDAAKASKKTSKIGKGAKKAAPLLAAAGLVGGVMYIDKKLSKESEAVQGCTTACLPSNYDQMVYGDLTKDKLKYKTLAELKKADPKTPEDQPLCNDKVSDCGKYCTDKCKEKHQSKIPGSGILSRGADAAGDVFKKINETLNPFAGPEGKKRMLIAGIILFLILFGPLVFKMMF